MLLSLWGAPALAQVDISGLWRPLPRNQDGSGNDRRRRWRSAEQRRPMAGSKLVSGRFRYRRMGLRPHVWDYSLEGPLSAMRIWTETDEATQKIVAYRGHINQEEQETTIWMDGRPHPPANALDGAAFQRANGTATRWS